MAFYKKKPSVVEAISFDEFIQFGKANTPTNSLVNGMPWSFKYRHLIVTHENDKCYLVADGSFCYQFLDTDVLVFFEDGTSHPMDIHTFNQSYEPA